MIESQILQKYNLLMVLYSLFSYLSHFWLFYKMVQVEDLTTGLGRSCGGGSVYNPSKYNLKQQRGSLAAE